MDKYNTTEKYTGIYFLSHPKIIKYQSQQNSLITSNTLNQDQNASQNSMQERHQL